MFRTVTDLKTYIAEKDISPEVLAKNLSISNMTIRRLLKKPPSAPIPAKYQLIFKWLGHSKAMENSETKNLSFQTKKKLNRAIQDPGNSETIRAVLTHLLSGINAPEVSRSDKTRLIKALQIFLRDY